jgi:hypothetical protein
VAGGLGNQAPRRRLGLQCERAEPRFVSNFGDSNLWSAGPWRFVASACGTLTRPLCYWAPREVFPGSLFGLLLRAELRAKPGVSLGRVDGRDGSKKVIDRVFRP